MSLAATVESANEADRLIIAFIREEVLLDPDFEIGLEDNLFTTGILDSVSIMRLVDYLERHYGFTVPPVDFVPQNFRSVEAMAAYVHSRTGSGR